MMGFFELFREPFKNAGLQAKIVHTIVCVFGVLLLVEAILHLTGSEYSQVRRILLDLASNLGAADYHEGMLLRLFFGLTIIGAAFTVVGLSATLIMHEPFVPASLADEIEKLHKQEEERKRTLH